MLGVYLLLDPRANFGVRDWSASVLACNSSVSRATGQARTLALQSILGAIPNLQRSNPAQRQQQENRRAYNQPVTDEHTGCMGPQETKQKPDR